MNKRFLIISKYKGEQIRFVISVGLTDDIRDFSETSIFDTINQKLECEEKSISDKKNELYSRPQKRNLKILSIHCGKVMELHVTADYLEEILNYKFFNESDLIKFDEALSVFMKMISEWHQYVEKIDHINYLTSKFQRQGLIARLRELKADTKKRYFVYYYPELFGIGVESCLDINVPTKKYGGNQLSKKN